MKIESATLVSRIARIMELKRQLQQEIIVAINCTLKNLLYLVP